MSTVPDSRDDLPRLLSALADGTLDPADEDRLAELLRTDPTARAKYYDHVMLAALLRREGRRAAAQGEASAPQNIVPEQLAATATKRPELAKPASRRLRPWLMVLAASVVLALLLSVGEATGLTEFVPTIVRIVTGEGSLVIEVDDPSVSVTLDGEDVTIKGAGIHELRLRPGTHKFTATKDGRPLREEVVKIERGGRQIVKVTRETGVEAQTPEDYLNRAESHASRGEFEKAIAAYEEIIRLKPNEAWIYGRIATIYLLGPEPVRDPQRALQFAEKASQQGDSHQGFHVLRGVAMYRLGRHREAVETLERYYEGEGRSFLNRVYAALSFHQQGETSKAKECYEQALKLPPAHGQFADVINKDAQAVFGPVEGSVPKAQSP
jgi:tetratricopeptide (TPR) repeat protein